MFPKKIVTATFILFLLASSICASAANEETLNGSQSVNAATSPALAIEGAVDRSNRGLSDGSTSTSSIADIRDSSSSCIGAFSETSDGMSSSPHFSSTKIPICPTAWCGWGGPPPNHTDLGPCGSNSTPVSCRRYRNNATGALCHDNCR